MLGAALSTALTTRRRMLRAAIQRMDSAEPQVLLKLSRLALPVSVCRGMCGCSQLMG